ncbi:MAG: hypothetical protein HZB56_19060 [Deltaproteobacteria bacterium]|nr:hypothetical protein [Deltaproteobacteria bacterium]
MTAKPVAAGRTGPAIPIENDAGPAATATAAGAAAATRMAEAGKKEVAKAGARRSGPAPSGAARGRGKLGKSVDKALGKVKQQAPAAARRAGGAQGRATTGATGYSTSAAATAATGEWAFLQDKNLSIDEKLFRYMMLLQKKADTELQQFLEATGPGAKGGTSSSKGTSLFDVAKAVIPALGLAESLIGEAGLKKLAGQLAGPVLAAAATAAGLPALAPAALQVGSSLVQMAFQDVGSRAATGTSTAPAANEYSKMTDEQRTLWLQHLLEKQKAMFTAVSNTLRCMHDTQMAAIGNIR